MNAVARQRRVAAVRDLRPRQARPEPRPRRLAARRRRRDGADPRPRPLHPPQRGREHLGGALERHRRLHPDEKDPFFAPAATRSTATRRSTTSPTTSRTSKELGQTLRTTTSTCPGRGPRGRQRRPLGVRHRLRGPAARRRHLDVPDGVDAAALAGTAWHARRRRPGLARSGWPSGALARPELEEELALANIGAGPARPGPAALLPGRTGRRHRPRRGRATRTSATRTSSATYGWPSCPTATSRSRSPGCWCCPPGGWPSSSGSPPRRPTRYSPPVAAKGVKELTYHRSTRPSGPCDSATAPRNRTAGCSDALTRSGPTSTSSSRLTDEDSARGPRSLTAPRGRLDRPGSASPPDAAPVPGHVAATASTPSTWPRCWPSSRAWPAQHPEATW
jgi:hypothetical protein